MVREHKNVLLVQDLIMEKYDKQHSKTNKETKRASVGKPSKRRSPLRESGNNRNLQRKNTKRKGRKQASSKTSFRGKGKGKRTGYKKFTKSKISKIK